MIVERIMTRQVASCGPDDTLEQAARLMFDNDCGFVPVVGSDGHVVGVLTDRDACMAAYTKAQPLSGIKTGDVMSRHVRSCRPGDQVLTVAQRMRAYRVRRMPVVDNDQLVGVVSIDDIVLAAERGHGKQGYPTAEEVVHTIAELAEQPHGEPEEETL